MQHLCLIVGYGTFYVWTPNEWKTKGVMVEILQLVTFQDLVIGLAENNDRWTGNGWP